MEGDLWSIETLRDVNSLAASFVLKKDFNGDGAVASYLFEKEKIMKLSTIALATAFTLTSTLALAQAPGLGGYGSVVSPSVGSYAAPAGSTNVVPTWRNTGPAAPLPSAPTFRNAFGNTFAPTNRAFGVRR